MLLESDEPKIVVVPFMNMPKNSEQCRDNVDESHNLKLRRD